jgi:RNA polymerase sigma factor (sigma-70 family)
MSAKSRSRTRLILQYPGRLTPQQQADLARQLRANPTDAEARQRLVDSTFGVVSQYVWSFLRTSPRFLVEDLEQECYAVLWEKAHQFDPDRGWVWNTYAGTVVRRHLLYVVEHRFNRLLPQAATDRQEEELEAVPDRDAEGPTSGFTEELNRLPVALATLPPLARTLVKLAFLDNDGKYSLRRRIGRAARELGMTFETAESVVQQALGSLRGLLGEAPSGEFSGRREAA